jgi:hypothetical protein
VTLLSVSPDPEPEPEPTVFPARSIRGVCTVSQLLPRPKTRFDIAAAVGSSEADGRLLGQRSGCSLQGSSHDPRTRFRNSDSVGVLTGVYCAVRLVFSSFCVCLTKQNVRCLLFHHLLICRNVRIDDVRPIRVADFVTALKIIRPSVSAASTASYQEWNRSFGATVS